MSPFVTFQFNLLLGVLVLACLGLIPHARDADRIQAYQENPFYWQYKGKPTLLLSGSWPDNVFNSSSLCWQGAYSR